ncbi:MAG: response regulator transcription factor [Candidatus Thiodiazotropha lotti]|uniref:DNA-binding response regulator n=1 Tax=Candidatus Thiodiazotropha endoloripes TaxID=1818881 RepID=A0A1E2UTQ2_9GAMM|nr:response regulator transcription factor [Candidatus Thiodiazotropha endoloripes]MCG7898546.1 response regulator transcription factor [Candidatus Thiodiazotropha weberae]MCG7990825.1 response regulator transcription factor [Candidatus Thiodiazotropha lotti]MCG7901456.1 response regulator transcription factor [Candidatus Thiodiazotropha weberae]MCG7913734.1 response regulator transcription factor [Candidatus Thiodiazotropha weberae]MCG7999311.1 response regulator transcription factor [Candida
MRLLLVEDDDLLSASLKKDLERQGYAVDLAKQGIEAEYMGDEMEYDLVVLDLGLPQRSGIDVLKNWRSKGNDIPVLILTARDAWHERVAGFKAGADDYLGKPFHVEELVVRLQALARRSHEMVGSSLKAGGVELDEEKQQLILPDQQRQDLTGTEFRLLRFFILNRGRILSKTRLIEHVYEQDFDRDSNLIEVYISRLREKLGKQAIETRRGQGYIYVGIEP